MDATVDYKVDNNLQNTKMEFNETKQKELLKLQKELELEKRRLEISKREFEIRCEFEKKCKEKQDELFRKRWAKLESEVSYLATERDNLRRQKKEFYEELDRAEQNREKNIVSGDMFFMGVDSELALKKRYKDLVKIFHPDNVSGDIYTIQEINREYDNLKKKLYAI